MNPYKISSSGLCSLRKCQLKRCLFPRQSFKPGTLWKISTAAEYLDDPEEPCMRETCSKKTAWQTLWQRPRESVVPTQEKGTVFAPPLCPSTVKSNLIRLDLDTKRVPGWNNVDAAKVTGSLDSPPGLVDLMLVLVFTSGISIVTAVVLRGLRGSKKRYRISCENPICR